MEPIRIRAVLFEEQGWWCAQCLEHDIAVQASSKTKLREELLRALETHLIASAQLGQTPFATVPPAPTRFFEMYEAAEKSDGNEEQLIGPADPNSSDRSVPFVSAPPVQVSGRHILEHV